MSFDFMEKMPDKQDLDLSVYEVFCKKNRKGLKALYRKAIETSEGGKKSFILCLEDIGISGNDIFTLRNLLASKDYGVELSGMLDEGDYSTAMYVQVFL